MDDMEKKSKKKAIKDMMDAVKELMGDKMPEDGMLSVDVKAIDKEQMADQKPAIMKELFGEEEDEMEKAEDMMEYDEEDEEDEDED